jgi:hypothetical protein
MERTWPCPECNTSNNESDTKCVKCKCFKSKSSKYKNKYNDWVCEGCNDSNFENRVNCRKCELPKPPKFLAKMPGSIDINDNRIKLSSHLDYKDCGSYLYCYCKTDEETVDYVYEEIQKRYPNHTLVIDNYMIHNTKNLSLAKLLIQKFQGRISFTNCELVGEHIGAYSGKRPRYIGKFTKEDYLLGG